LDFTDHIITIKSTEWTVSDNSLFIFIIPKASPSTPYCPP